jgi:phospholipid transport system substrate-binding protein
MSFFIRRRNILRLSAGAATLAVTALGLTSGARADAGQEAAAELIERTAAQVIKLVETQSGAAREAAILRVLQTDFDLDYMVRFALGTHWNQATPEQRERFTRVAANAEAHAYARRFGQSGGQTLIVDRATASSRGAGVSVVDSKLKQSDGEPLAIRWEVRTEGAGPRIVDIKVGGVSMAMTRRADFNSYIQAHGGKVEPLIDELEARAKR